MPPVPLTGDADDAGHLEGLTLGPRPEVLSKHYEAALLDAHAVLDLDASNAKAHYRKAQVGGTCSYSGFVVQCARL